MSVSRRAGVAFAVGAALLAVSTAWAFYPESKTGAEATRLDRFVTSGGEAYFALSLVPPAQPSAAAAREIAILIDTSASQAGIFRARSLDALEGLLSGLGPDDRVRLVAVDLDAVPLNDDFVPVRDGSLERAMAALRDRVPLGSTDMAAMLESVAEMFAAPSDAERAVIYIGDGVSTTNLLASARLSQLTERLVERRVPVTSYAVGPRIDGQLLAALANQTGGTLALDGEDLDTASVGAFLARAARQTVIWPGEIELPEGIVEVYPAACPPLRADRDTVLIGLGAFEGPGQVRIRGEAAGAPVDLTFDVAATEPAPEHAYLAQVVAAARRDGGRSLPALGSQGLWELRRMLEVAVEDLNQLGRQAVAAGSLDHAEDLAEAAGRLDPTNPTSAQIQRVAARMRAGETGAAPDDADFALGAAGGAAGAADDAAAGSDAAGSDAAAGAAGRGLRLVRQPSEAAAEVEIDVNADPFEVPGSLVSDVERHRQVVTGQMQAVVQDAIHRARSLMADNAQGAMQLLKEVQERVRRTAELNPEVRGQLDERLVSAMRQTQRQAEDLLRLEIRRQELEAQAEERRRLNEELYWREQKIAQLSVRFNALIDERRFRDAEEVMKAAYEINPNDITTNLALEHVRMLYPAAEAYRYRRMRWVGVVDALASVERSHVPTPDEPPIIYPPAEVWKLLTERRKEFAAVSLASEKPAETRIREALDDSTVIEFVEQPLEQVLTYLEDLHDIEIEIDDSALDDLGISRDAPITREVRGISLRSGLRLILTDLDLTYIIKDEVLLITSVERAEEELVTKVYPVADLVVPIQSGGFGGGMGGGMMGGGMMGGGMGGGGFGGGGFGGGGFGGGGMGGMGGGGFGGGGFGGRGGGNFFNLPLNNNNAGGEQNLFRAFSVADDLTAAAPVVPAPRVPRARPTAGVIEIDLPDGADAEVAWNDYFAHHAPEPAEVRLTAGKLMSERRYDELIALLRAALRHSQGQPWMYEGLALAMQAAGRPDDEVERVLLSALDFTDNVTDLLYVAQYLDRLGFANRALKLYQQAAELNPLDETPYILGLKLAQQSEDLAALRWATVGVLSRAWPNDKPELWQTARRLGAAAIERLASEGRDDDAVALREELNAALERDVIVAVSWTGDADIDILVEEPTGTVCSSQVPRTTAGGSMQGDDFPRGDDDGSRTYVESYVCPQAFDGTYRVLLRRVWGQPTAGKVTVEVTLHEGTSRARTIRQQVPISGEEALVVFELSEGRRTESLDEIQLASAVEQQMAIRRELLNQQIASQADPRAERELAVSRHRALQSRGRPILPGQAGFQPVITVLPKGTIMGVTGVISADRRYVRVTPFPQFNAISEVFTFNTFTGQTEQTNSGVGGGGFAPIGQ